MNLNTVNFWIGSTNTGDNQWIVNDQYVGVNIPGIGFIPDTDPQIPPIFNNPNSSYLHTVSASLLQSPGVENAHYSDFATTGNFETISTEMSFDVSTIGLTDVTIEFWWLCGDEDPATVFPGFGGGQLHFSTDGGGTWTNVFPNPLQSASWTQESITNPLFDNVANLRFMFSFNNTLGGSPLLGSVDPVGFAIDDLKFRYPQELDLVLSILDLIQLFVLEIQLAMIFLV